MLTEAATWSSKAAVPLTDPAPGYAENALLEPTFAHSEFHAKCDTEGARFAQPLACKIVPRHAILSGTARTHWNLQRAMYLAAQADELSRVASLDVVEFRRP